MFSLYDHKNEYLDFVKQGTEWKRNRAEKKNFTISSNTLI
jgi:hypothetical protein